MFLIRNDSTRDHVFANGPCRAGAGHETPAALRKIDLSLPPVYSLTEEQMWKSWRGVLSAMKQKIPFGEGAGKFEITVLVDDVELTPEDLIAWVADWRATKGLPEPKTRAENAREIEAAMNRAPDAFEVAAREAELTRQKDLIAAVTSSVLTAVRANQ